MTNTNGTVPNGKTRGRVGQQDHPKRPKENTSASYGTHTKNAGARIRQQPGTRASEPVEHSAQDEYRHPQRLDARAPVGQHDDDKRLRFIRAEPGIVEGAERTKLADGFGAELKRRRKQLGYTQVQAAGLAGIGRVHLSNLERGYKRPSHDAIQALARALEPDDQAALVDDLTDLAGASVREGAARRKRRADAQGVRRMAAQLRSQSSTWDHRIDKLRAAGQNDLADKLEELSADHLKELERKDAEAIRDLESLGDNPDDFAPLIKRAPKHFRKRSYGPGTGRGGY